MQPDVAVFGQKDAQQLYLIRKMVAGSEFSDADCGGETAREADGLARSSRNVYLKVAEREQATVLYRALLAGQAGLCQGSRSLAGNSDGDAGRDGSHARVSARLCDRRGQSSSFQEEDPVPAAGRLIIAGRLGSVRLIDNFALIPMSENGTDEPLDGVN